MIRAAIIVVLLGTLRTSHAAPLCRDLPAAERPRCEAIDLAGKGAAAYEAGDYAGALEQFERAYQLFPNARLLRSLGATLKQMGRLVDAANRYQEFLDDPKAEAALVSEIRTVLQTLDASLVRLTIELDVADAEVKIDDQPWRPADRVRLIRIAAGVHVVRARRDELTAEVTVSTATGEIAPVKLALHREATPSGRTEGTIATVVPEGNTAVTTTATASATRPGRKQRIAAIAAGGSGVVLVGVGVAFAIGASRERDRVGELCGGAIDACDPSGYNDAKVHHERAGRDALLANLGIGLGAAAVVTGAVLWLTAPSAERSPRLTTTLGRGHVGLALAGWF